MHKLWNDMEINEQEKYQEASTLPCITRPHENLLSINP